MEDIINTIYEKIKNLESGTEFRISQFFDEELVKDCSQKDFMEITNKVLEKCKDNNIKIVSKDKGVIGLPYVVTFIKE